MNRFLLRVRNRALRVARLSGSITLSREGWYYIFVVAAVFTGAVVRDSNLMLLLGGMLAGPLVLSLWFALRGLRRIDVRRRLPESVCVGEPLVVEVTCSNRRRRLASWALVVEDAFQYYGPLAIRRPSPARVLFPFVGPGTTCQATYTGTPPLRGRYSFGPLRISTRFPLGLFRHQCTFDLCGSLIIWPRLGRLTPGGLLLEQRSEAGLQRTERRQARREADFYGLRDWRSGDSRRWIHWRSTARRGQLVVRQFDESRSEDLALLVDLWQPPGDEKLARERVETAISLAASVLADACRRGGRRLTVHLAAAEPFKAQGWTSQPLLREVLDALALAVPRDSDLPPDFVQHLADIHPPLMALVISTRPLDLAAIRQSSRRPGAAGAVGTIKLIDVSSADLGQFFELIA